MRVGDILRRAMIRDRLIPGDVLLYDSPGLIAWVIRMKTWGDVTHTEVYLGERTGRLPDGTSYDGPACAAARGPQDAGGGGVQTYPLRTEGLRYVMRPTRPFDLVQMERFHRSCIGQRYDLWGVLRVFALQGHGALDRAYCSEHTARMCGTDHGGPGLVNIRYDCDRVSPPMCKASPSVRPHHHRGARGGSCRMTPPDLRSVGIVLGAADVFAWPRTSRITAIALGAHSLTIDHSKRGEWPAQPWEDTTQEGTIWLLAQIGGRWYAGAGERLRPGQTTKDLDVPAGLGRDWFYRPEQEPLHSWSPTTGEVFGFLVSTPARTEWPDPHERTDVVLVEYPSLRVVWREGDAVEPPDAEPETPPADDPPADTHDEAAYVAELRGQIAALAERVDAVSGVAVALGAGLDALDVALHAPVSTSREWGHAHTIRRP